MALPNGVYIAKDHESEILKNWLEKGMYKPEFDPVTNKVLSTEEMKKDKRTPWSLICPPPNAYGRPHIGNISGYAYQDAMARFQRMQGKKVLVLPGKDHAGLEGEGVFVREVLEKKKINKFDLKREEFYQMMMDFNQENMKKALKDEQDIGLSADFDRNIFTLDEQIVEIILSTFVQMYKEGMIYKGVRIVNWDPKARSTLADNQCEREEREGNIYNIRYKLAKGEEYKHYKLDEEGKVIITNFELRNYVEVATTRPETMFGDTAVAINPSDPRYSDLLGKTVLIPLIDKEIPIITSHKVEKSFGTGALKITPAHALDDYHIMMEWNAENPSKEIGYVNVIGQDIKMYGPVPEKYKGVVYYKVKDQIIEDLKIEGYIVKEEKIKQNILISERTKSIVEPIMSSQWFVDIEKVRQPVIDMVKNKEVRLHPENMEKAFFHWMENLRDWAISRSLWWGYRMPVWYSGEISEYVGDDGQVRTTIKVNGKDVGLDPTNPEHMRVQVDSPGENWIQDENVLDTWFSSGQWPFATLNVYDLMDTFYPTDVMETGYDILENWVSRMMMFSYIKHKTIPFKDVYLHGLVKGTDGQKMSKSKGNLINIDEVRETYGTDSVRMVYFYQNSAGASYAMTFDKLKNFKQFMNKIWNASKFVFMNIEGVDVSQSYDLAEGGLKLENSKNILKHTNETKDRVTKNINEFDFGLATFNLYNEFWHTYCDVYLESSKDYVKEGTEEEKKETGRVLLYALKTYLKMLHPFIPFITERIWKEVPKEEGDHESLMYTSW